MNKQAMLKWVNALMGVTLLMTASGGLIRKFFPDAIPYATFRAFHPNVGVAFVVLICLHIWLNFGWIRSTYFGKK